MSTNSLTIIKEDDEVLVKLYSHYDGYPSDYGKELALFLNNISLINGLKFNEKRKVANGMGCLAAQIIAHFKIEPGNFYISSSNSEDFVYTVYYEDILKIKVETMGNILFDGNTKNYLEWVKDDTDTI